MMLIVFWNLSLKMYIYNYTGMIGIVAVVW